jgi:hypothetical protein
MYIFVFAVKHDLRHQARLVAGGYLTDPNTSLGTTYFWCTLEWLFCLCSAPLGFFTFQGRYADDIMFIGKEPHCPLLVLSTNMVEI